MICTLRAKILLLTFLILNSVSAQNFYVNKFAAGTNDGRSWTNAWTSIEDSSAANPGGIDWSVAGEGDTIFISGGMDSTTYAGSLTIRAAGTPGNNLVITKGLEIGHNGKVIIDGGVDDNTVDFTKDVDYVTLSYLTFKGSTLDFGDDQGQINMVGHYSGSYGSYIQTNPVQGVIVENCEHFVEHNQAIHMKSTKDIIIRNCLIVTTSNDSGQTDGIYSQIGYNNIFDGNSIYINNTNLYPHCDGIQMNQDSNAVVRNNYIEQNNSKDRNAQGIYATECFGTLKFYNNIINMTTAKSNAIVWRKFDIGDGDVIINSNTIYGEGTVSTQNAHAIWVTDPNNPPVIKNNIIQWVDNPAIGIHVIGSNYDSTDANLQYNVFVTRGTNIITSDPLFTDPSNDDFNLHPYSPAIDSGTTLISPYNVDKNGISRPQFGGYDAGALESSNRLPVLEPVLEQNINEGDSLNLILSATDPDGDNLTLTVPNLPVFGILNDNGDGTGSITFTPDAGDSGVYSDILVMAKDDGLPSFTDTTSFTITVVIEAIIAPDNLSASASAENEVELSWTDNSNNEDTFIIERETLQTEEYQFIVSIGSNITTYIDTTVLDGQRYNYRVKAINNFTESGYTESVQVVTVLPAPSDLTARIYNPPLAVHLDWIDNSDNESGFVITKKDTITAFFAEYDTVDANMTTYSDTNVTSTSEYLYKVYAISIDTLSAYSDTAQVIVPVELASFKATVTGNSVHLVWRTVTELNNKGFEIERILIKEPSIKGGNNEEWETIAFVPGKGTTTEASNYKYLDCQVPFKANGF
jgi:hypothetical protein